MAKVRATRRMRYGTRMLRAGDEFEVSRRSDARFLTAIGYVEAVPEAAIEPQRRTRRPRPQDTVASEPAPAVEAAPEPEVQSLVHADAEELAAEAAADPPDDLEDHTRDELLAMAEERGVELPSGYVRKDELVELLRAGEESSRP